MISDNIIVILPIIYPALFEMSKAHWNQQIVQLTQNVLRYLHDVNRMLYDDVVAKYRQNLVKYASSWASLVKERSCRNALDRSRHLQEHSRSFSDSFAPRALS